MVDETNHSRRDVLKQLGVGVAGSAAGGSVLAASAGTAEATTGFVDGGDHYMTDEGDYPYEWSDGESAIFGGDFNPEAKRAWDAGVRTEVVNGDKNGEAVIGVEVFAGMATRFTEDMSYDCEEIEEQRVEITYDETDHEDIVTRTDDDWVGAHEVSGTDMGFVSDSVETFVGYGADLVNDTIGTAYSVVMDTADFIAGLTEAIDQTDRQEFQWNYVTDETRIYSGKKDAQTSAYFEVYLDPGQRITFDVKTTNVGREYANVGHRTTFHVGYPDPEDDNIA